MRNNLGLKPYSVRCPACKHKLFVCLGIDERDRGHIQIKCSSCGEVVDVVTSSGEVCVYGNGKRDFVR